MPTHFFTSTQKASDYKAKDPTAGPANIFYWHSSSLVTLSNQWGVPEWQTLKLKWKVRAIITVSHFICEWTVRQPLLERSHTQIWMIQRIELHCGCQLVTRADYQPCSSSRGQQSPELSVHLEMIQSLLSRIDWSGLAQTGTDWIVLKNCNDHWNQSWTGADASSVRPQMSRLFMSDGTFWNRQHLKYILHFSWWQVHKIRKKIANSLWGQNI